MTKFRLLKIMLLILLCTHAAQTAHAQSESEILKQLRADYASLMDAVAEYEKAAANGSMSAGERDDYSFWIMQLREQFTETCHILSNHPDVEMSADIPCSQYASSYTEPADIDIEQEYTDGEKTASVEGQFNHSLGDFDEKLLREQDRVKAMRPQNSSAGSGGGGGMAGDGSGNGDGDSSSGGESGDGDEEGGQQSDGQSDGQSGRKADQQGGGSGRSGDQSGQGTVGTPQRGNPNNIPDDIPDGGDDDVVARQLREAAEKETDPELREKLWDEYRRYKQGQ